MYDCCGQVGEDDCVNLKRRYGSRFRIGYEDPAFSGGNCPWHFVLLGKHGHVSPAGSGILWACSKTRTGRANLQKLINSQPTECVIQMDGDDGINMSFDPAHLSEVAKALHLLRR